MLQTILIILLILSIFFIYISIRVKNIQKEIFSTWKIKNKWILETLLKKHIDKDLQTYYGTQSKQFEIKPLKSENLKK